MKNNFKRIIALILVMLSVLSLFSCNGEIIIGGGVSSGNGGNTGNTGDTGGEGEFVPPEMNDDPTDDFTVTLYADGMPYSPRMEMYAYWNNGFSVHTAKFNSEGIARIDGLDGDYRVTLSQIPNEYAYDPNTNIATNDDRNIVVNMYTLNVLSGGGLGIYDCLNFKNTGVYCATIDSPDDAIYFQYAPSGQGTYSIESWIDTTADNVNPYIDVYYGNSQWKQYEKTIDGGGAVGSYTINFIHTVQIASENISAGGQATYTFAIKAETKNNKYPVTITFAVKRNGDFELQRPVTPGGSTGTGKVMAVPELDFSSVDMTKHEYDNSYRLVYPEYRLTPTGNIYVFDEDRYKIWEKSKGGDGFYHVYDTEKYAETGGYGPILYANITSACRFLDVMFSKIEYRVSTDQQGNVTYGETINAALSVNGVNYKHFIEGYTFLSTFGNVNGGSYYCVSDCPCHDKDESTLGFACPMTKDAEGNYQKCAGCDGDCRGMLPELEDCEGYQSIANSDGMAPVTEELKVFLEGYCLKQAFFFDGKGSLEVNDTNGKLFQAVGNSGWLFACAYYEKR